MSSWFWIGIIIFVIGVIVRLYFKFKYYREYKASAHTERKADELRSKYRPLVFVGLGIETVGCIITVISAFG